MIYIPKTEEEWRQQYKQDFKQEHERPETILVGADREGLLKLASGLQRDTEIAIEKLHDAKDEIEWLIDKINILNRVLRNPLASEEQVTPCSTETE